MRTVRELLLGVVFSLILTFALGFILNSNTEMDNSDPEKAAAESQGEEKPEIIEAQYITVNSNEISAYEPTELNAELIELNQAPEFKTLNIPLDSEIQEYLKDKCEEANIDYALVLGLIDTESNFTANAKSKTGDFGLMQINKCNHKALSLKTGAVDLLDPCQNIDAGMWMLTDLFEKYGEAELVLMAYHFGEVGAKKLWNQGKFTSAYSKSILEKQLSYQEMIDEVYS